jgi:hypothetical protein
MTDLAAILAPQFVSGVAFYTERLDSDAPYRDHAAADKAAQAEALRRVDNALSRAGVELIADLETSTDTVAGLATAVVILRAVAHELGVEL